MTKKIPVKPNIDKTTGLPKTLKDRHMSRPLPKEGGFVPNSVFWRRRLLCGDATRLTDDEAKALRQKSKKDPPKAEEKKPPAAPAKPKEPPKGN